MFLMLHELKSSQNGWEMGATLAWTHVVHGFWVLFCHLLSIIEKEKQTTCLQSWK